MVVTIHASSAKNIRIIDKILIAGRYSFHEKREKIEDNELSAQSFRTMIKARKPRMIGKSLQNL
jgi:hypothetical protein